jgi:hypothetical protein
MQITTEVDLHGELHGYGGTCVIVVIVRYNDVIGSYLRFFQRQIITIVLCPLRYLMVEYIFISLANISYWLVHRILWTPFQSARFTPSTATSTQYVWSHVVNLAN